MLSFITCQFQQSEAMRPAVWLRTSLLKHGHVITLEPK